MNLMRKKYGIYSNSFKSSNIPNIPNLKILPNFLYIYDNITAIVLWPTSLHNNTIHHILYDELRFNGIIHNIKKVHFSQEELFTFIQELYQGNVFIKSKSKVIKKQKKVGGLNKINTIFIIFYETKKEICGKNAPYKQYLRKLLQMELLRKNIFNNSSRSLLHATDNHQQTIDLAKLIF